MFFKGCPRNSRPLKPTIELVEAHVELDGLDMFGRVTLASLLLKGKVVPVGCAVQDPSGNTSLTDFPYKVIPFSRVLDGVPLSRTGPS